MSRMRGVVCFIMGAMALAGPAFGKPPLADVSYLGSSVEFAPREWGREFLLTVSAPDGSVVQKIGKDGVLSFNLSELKGAVIDGRYKYELVPIVSLPRQRDVAPHKADPGPRIEPSTLSGSFLVAGGNIVRPGGVEPDAGAGGPDAPDDYLVTDDLIVIGRACVGAGCVNGESFTGADDGELRLKGNNTSVNFVDTSTGSFPANDWRIRANGTTSGSASYMSVVDETGGTMPFVIEAGAANNVLYVDSLERVGINTSAPIATLHVRDASSPGIVMDQTSPAYQWRIYADNDCWFLWDHTGGTFPIFVENDDTAPVYSMIIKGDGKVGWGTYSPDYQFEVYRSDVNSNVVVTRGNGATNYINATASYGNFGTVSNHPLRLVVNSAWQMRINNDSSITMANGASLTAGGVWTDYSSRAAKKDIQSLSIEEASAALSGLEPVKFAYKANGERHVGFIAEDVPELVASADRSGLSPMDLVAVLTRVMQQQQGIVQEQRDLIQAQRKTLLEQQSTIDSMLARISALESR